MLTVIALIVLGISIATLLVVLKLISQVNAQLGRVSQSLQEAQTAIGSNLGSAARVFGTVEEKLGRLEETNRQLVDIGKDIAGLQDLLRVPKLRGQLGEMFLENLLSQILPKEYFQVQYRFKTADTVDAVIRLAGKLVPVDAKFPLENFQKMAQASDDQEKAGHRRKFVQDVKNRIDEIAAKYILPGENTYDFALMYVPAENVYYEIIIKEDLFAYSTARKVIPVSPNTFYAYLQVICLGLKGMKIEENAVQILKDLGALSVDIGKFKDDFTLVGGHLANAGRKYEDSARRLERFLDRLGGIQQSKQLE